MGVKNFIKTIVYYSPQAISLKKISDYSNTTIGIDGNLMMYKNILSIRKKEDIYNKDGSRKIIVTHIHSLINKFNGFKKYNITPIFVFDGKYPKIKEKTMEKRGKLGIDISSEIEDCIELIKLYGYTVIHADLEADLVLSYLSKRREIDYIVSDDMDMLVFGGLNILRNFTVNKLKFIEEITLKTILTIIDITREQLIDIALLLGTDYDIKLGKHLFGPIKSVAYIKQIDSLSKSKLQFSKKKYSVVVQYYLQSTKPKYIKESGKYSRKKIIKYLNKFGYDATYYDKYIPKK